MTGGEGGRDTQPGERATVSGLAFDPQVTCSASTDGRLNRLRCLRIARRKTLPSIIGNSPVDDGTAIDALPGVKNEEEVGEPLQHHESFALRTFHLFLPGFYGHS